MEPETRELPAEQLEVLHREYLDRVQRTYPGIRRWFSFERQPDGVVVVAYDLDRDQSEPVYVLKIANREWGLLMASTPGHGMSFPAMTHAENLRGFETGEVPPGFIPAPADDTP